MSEADDTAGVRPARNPLSTIEAPVVERLSEYALLLRWSDTIDARINAQVHAFAQALLALAPAWLVDVVPAYASVAVLVDDAFARSTSAMPGDPLDAIARQLLELCTTLHASGDARVRVVEIPVRYGGDAGPDLQDVAAHTGMDADAVVARHSGVDYRVAMLGFAPGFPYLLGLDPALATPRLAQPRIRIPAGSVGIGGAQTGVYPRPGPGGWRLIGCTDAVLFDARRDPPSLLQPGDSVRFVPVQR